MESWILKFKILDVSPFWRSNCAVLTAWTVSQSAAEGGCLYSPIYIHTFTFLCRGRLAQGCGAETKASSPLSLVDGSGALIWKSASVRERREGARVHGLVGGSKFVRARER